MENMDDKFLTSIKKDWNFGRYQWRVMCLFFLSISGWNMGYFCPIFLTPKVEHWCSDSSSSFTALNSSQQRFIMGDSCTKPDVNFSQYSIEELLSIDFRKFNRTTCDDGYVFARDVFDYTATEKFGLVCDREWIISVFYTCNMLGQLIVTFAAGPLSDHYGRRTALIIFAFTGCACYYALALVPHIIPFILIRIICSGTDLGLSVIVNMLNMEIMKIQHRKMPRIFDCLSMFFWVALLGVILLYLKNFEHLLYLIASIDLGTVIMDYFFYPESPRWLAHKKKSKQLKKMADEIENMNNSCGLMEEITKSDPSENKDENDVSLVKIPLDYPVLRKRVIICWSITSCTMMVYFAILFGLQDIGPDIRYSLIISACLDVPGLLILLFTIDRLGRQISSFVFLTLSGIFCLATAPLVQQTDSYILTILALLGKTFITINISILFIHIPELFPTVCRGRVLFSCMTLGRGIALLAPQIQHLNKFWPPCTAILLGCYGLICATFVPFLPDTTGRQLTQTLEEGERFCGDHGYKLIFPVKSRDRPMKEISL